MAALFIPPSSFAHWRSTQCRALSLEEQAMLISRRLSLLFACCRAWRGAVLGLCALWLSSAALAVEGAQTNTAKANDPCYRPEEVEAERAIRLHTDMMVTSLSCRPAAQDPADPDSLFARYKSFTLRNQAALSAQEKILIDFYRRQGQGKSNPVQSFDRLRTQLANEASQRLIALTLPIYCESRAPLTKAWAERSLAEALQAAQADDKALSVSRVRHCPAANTAPTSLAKPPASKPAKPTKPA
jgi:hypothetical protein